jgi:peptidoglycan/xylan/chitin deacetylase (PgdA/CDA1 family)
MPFSPGIDPAWRRPVPAPAVSVLMYHQVGPFESPARHRSIYCHVRRFEAQMAFLHRFPYAVMGLAEAMEGLFRGSSLPRRAVVITFDDGYQSFFDHALPVLAGYDLPCAVFAVTDRIGATAQWLEGPPPGPRLMDAATLRKLARYRVEVGCHSRSHPRLSRLTPPEVADEVLNSKSTLEEVLGRPVRYFCYPYGDYSPAVREVVEAAGYEGALTCIRGAANTAENPFEVPRKAVSYGDNLLGYFWKLHMKNARKDARPGPA